jgi:multidrug efflux pump
VFSRFFIDRPIFAAVLSIVITLAGVVALFSLPLAEYPQITPPTVQVNCQYPGASAQVVAQTIAAPIEQQVNGVEDMLYMSSQSTNDGQYNLTVTFKNGVDLNMAQVLVQNRVNLALPLLPDVIRKTGVITRKRSPDILLFINFVSPDGRYDQLYMSNYALMQVRDELARLAGVGDVLLFGQRDYSMRVWVDPDKLASRNLTAGDVANALREQNAPVALGQVGQSPAPRGQDYQVPLCTLGRLAEPEQFAGIVLKTTPDGRMTRLKDVARVELAAKSVDVGNRVDGRPAVALGVMQLPDANAFDTAARVRAKMEELAKDFPEGLTYIIPYDTTPFIRESINEVFKALRDAIVLVAVVVLLFLQNWRSALIPLVAVPVAVVGAFAVMAAFGFSLNNLTLFGLVLAIGIVVDDAIVVVEAVEHHVERGLAPREATLRAMRQVSGPVVAVGLVLCAVFVPCAFIGGITGQFFRQFALTIAVSTLLSAFNSLTLSPALAALLLRPRVKGSYEALPRLAFVLLGAWLAWQWLAPLPWVRRPLGGWASWAAPPAGAAAGLLAGGPLNWLLGWSFRLFNLGFDRSTGAYTWVVGGLLRLRLPVLLVYAGLLGLTWVGFTGIPKAILPAQAQGMKLGSFDLAAGLPRGFIPAQDLGYLLVNVQLPDAASDERTREVMAQVEQIAAGIPGVKHTVTISGQSFVLSAFGSNFGSMFLILDPFDQRQSPELYSDAIAARVRTELGKISGALVAVFGPPPVRGVGTAGGFKVMIEDRGDLGMQNLQEVTEALTQAGNQTPGLVGLFGLFRANVPQLYADVDRRQAMSMQVPLGDAFDTLQIYLGSLYVNDFNRFGRTWQVNIQAEDRFRSRIEDVGRLKVRNALGGMVPLGSLASVREDSGPLILMRYNMYPAAFINGGAAPGVSSGESMNLVQQLAEKHLPQSMAYEWTEMAFLEQQAGNTAMILFGFSVVMVFLVLAAQYESWSLPLAVILVVPLCLLSALAGVAVARMDVNILTQTGFVVLVGLASKNAILIVEFAKLMRHGGMPRREATLAACRLRLRPIIMTSFAFILGVVPLLLSHGAGAEMRRSLGTAVFSGMLGVTAFGVFLTPVFFFVLDALAESRLFSSRFMRQVGAVGLVVATAGVPRLLALVRNLQARSAGGGNGAR